MTNQTISPRGAPKQSQSTSQVWSAMPEMCGSGSFKFRKQRV